jgi:branched-chain amino acid transport system permease protein
MRIETEAATISGADLEKLAKGPPRASRARVVGGGLAVLVLVSAAAPFLDSYQEHILVVIGVYVALTVSWNLLAGFTGLYSSSHPAMMAIGAYGSAVLAAKHGLSPWLTICIGTLISAFFGAVLGAIVLRLRIIYFILATFALTEITRLLLTLNVELTGGSLGLATPFLFDSNVRVLYVPGSATLAVTTCLTVWAIMRSRFGILLLSIREDELAAEAMGVKTFHLKVGVFTISSAMAGLAGAYLGHYLGVVSPSIASLDTLGRIIIMVVLGGVGTIWGPILGAVIVTCASELFRAFEAEWILALCIMVLIVMRIAPGGLMELFGRLRRLRPDRRS